MFLDIFLLLLSILVFLYDFITLPFYWLIQLPYRKKQVRKHQPRFIISVTRSEVKKRSRFSLKTSEEYISLKKEVKTTNKYFEDLVVKDLIRNWHLVVLSQFNYHIHRCDAPFTLVLNRSLTRLLFHEIVPYFCFTHMNIKLPSTKF